MRGIRHLICVSGYRDSLCHVANCLGKSASFLQFWIAANFTCCGTRFSALYCVQRKTRCQQIRLLPRGIIIRLLDLPSSQRIRLLYTWTSGSTRMASATATDAGREGVWSSQTPISRNWLRQNFGIWLPLKIRFKAEDFVFSIVFSIGGFVVANRLAIPRAKRFAIPHSTLCPVASFGTTNRDRKFLGALFCSGALWEHCVRRFIPDLNVDYREPRLAEQFPIFETFLPLTKYLFRPSSYTCSFGLHLAYVHGSLSNRERPLRFSNGWRNLNEQHHESISWNFHRASEIWYFIILPLRKMRFGYSYPWNGYTRLAALQRIGFFWEPS